MHVPKSTRTMMGIRIHSPRVISHLTILAVLGILAMLLALMTLVLGSASSYSGVESIVMATFAMNAALGLLFLARSIMDRPFSLVQIHWLFYVTMFVIAPASQYLYGYSVWGYALSTEDYLTTNILLFIWGALFALFTSLRAKGCEDKETSAHSLFESVPVVSRRAAIAIFALAAIATVIVVSSVGFENLFSRGTYSTGLDKTSGLIFDKAIRPLPVFAFALLYIRYRQSHAGLVLLIYTGLFVLVADFPTAMARHSAACLYGGLALVVFDQIRTKRGLFPALLLIAFLVVFPASNVYRYGAFELSAFLESLVDAFANLSQGFCAIDYDAYSMIPRALHYIGSNGATYGFQLLSVLLFFVPRAIWPLKSSGSGYLIAASQGQAQLNVSCPLPGEGIINFGIFGLIVFAIALAFVCKWADKSYQIGGGLCIFCPFACLMLFFIMRGDLLSSFAFLCGYLVSFLVLWAIVRAFPSDYEKVKRAG